MIPNQLLPLLYGDDYLGIAREGTIASPRRAVIGRVQVLPRFSGQARVVPRLIGDCRVVPRFSAIGGTPVNSEAAAFAAAKQALFREPWPVLSDATGFIERFVDIINDPASVPENFLEYLLTEGWEYGIDEAPEGDTLDERHLLYWLDRKLKEYKATIGYVNRLSEAGASWGSAAPTNLAAADPLGLATVLTNLGVHYLLIDNDAADDASQSSTDGCVRVTYRGGSSHPCTTIGGLAKNNNGSGGLFTSSAEAAYFYHFLKALDDIHETPGGVRRFPINPNPPAAPAECVVLVRWATDHQVSREMVLIKQSTVTDAGRITITGYPGEFPAIRMGNSTTSTANGATGAPGNERDATPTANEIGVVSGATARPAMITVGDGVDSGRTNVHFRNIDFVGNRTQAGGSGQIFASRIIRINATATGGSIRHCGFRGTQFIRDDDPISGFNTLRDAVWTARNPATQMRQSGGVDIFVQGYVFDANYIEPVAKAAWPGNDINPLSIAVVWLDMNNVADVRITRNTFRGVKTNSMIRYGRSDTAFASRASGGYIADNDMEVYDKTCIDVFRLRNFTVERNRLHDYGSVDYQLDSGGDGIKLNDCDTFIARYNVVFNHEPAISAALGIAINASGGGANGASSGGQVYGNLLYRAVLRLDDNGGGGNITDTECWNNLHAGMTEARKATNHTNAPIHVELTLTLGTLEGNTIRDSNVWRFADLTPDQATIEAGPHLGIRNTGAGATYEVTDTLTGWTGNTKERPSWAGDPEADDLRLDGTNSFASWFPATMPFTAVLSKAWSPE